MFPLLTYGSLLSQKKEIAVALGTVKWFNATKGYGFITVDGVAEDIFVHHTVIDAQGYRTLTEGQRVTIDYVNGAKGLQASVVKLEV